MSREIGLQARLEICLGPSPHSIATRKVSADFSNITGASPLLPDPSFRSMMGGPLPACAPGRCLQAGSPSSPGLPSPGCCLQAGSPSSPGLPTQGCCLQAPLPALGSLLQVAVCRLPAPGRCLQAPCSSPGLPLLVEEGSVCSKLREHMEPGGSANPLRLAAFLAKVLKLTVSRWYQRDYRKDFHRCLHLWDSDSVDLGWRA